MSRLNLVVIGASAGGLDALLAIIEAVRADLPAAIIIAVHTRAERDGMLPRILSRRSEAPVAFARHGDRLHNGHIIVVPPDVHLIIDRDRVVLHRGPTENGFRPAIDPLFRSAARTGGGRVIGVILSGALDDGTVGLKRIKEAGGVAIVQDPDDAAVPSMPLSAIRAVEVDYVVPASQIGRLIGELAGELSAGRATMAKRGESEPQRDTTEIEDMDEEFGPPTGLTCPDCGGALWEIKDGKLVRYRCHVGHQYLQESLDAEQRDMVEGALWTAVRSLEERAELRERLARRAEQGGTPAAASRFLDSARDAKQQATTIRELLLSPAEHRANPRPRVIAKPKARAKRRKQRAT